MTFLRASVLTVVLLANSLVALVDDSCAWRTSLQWEASIPGAASYPPLYTANAVITVHPGSISATATDSGEILWHIRGDFIGGCVTLDADRVACLRIGAVVALNIADGTQTHQYTLPAGKFTPNSAPLHLSRFVFAAADNGLVVGLDRNTLALKWSTDLTAEHSVVSPVSAFGNYLVVGCLSGTVFLLQATDGAIYQSYSTPGVAAPEGISSGVTVFGNRAYYTVDSATNNLVALNLNTMTVVWRLAPLEGSFAATAPTINVDSGSVYTTTTNGHLFSIADEDGSIEWSANIGQQLNVRGPIAFVANDLIALSTNSGAIVGYDVSAKAVRFSLKMHEGFVRSSPGLSAEGDSIVVSTSQVLYRMDLQCTSGKIKRF